MTAFLAALVLLGGCASHEAATPIASPHADLQPRWAVFDSLDVFNEAVKSLVAEQKATPRYYQMLDAVVAGEVKAHILSATDYVVRRKIKQDVAANPVAPSLAVNRLIVYTADCVVARVVVDYTPQRAANRDQNVNPKLASYFALFRRDPNGPDPLGINPSGWRWEQFIRENADTDPRGVRIDKELTGQAPNVRSTAPYNACHATAGLGDDCSPPAPEPPVGTENDLGRAVVAFLACPVADVAPPTGNPLLDPRAAKQSAASTTTTVP